VFVSHILDIINIESFVSSLGIKNEVGVSQLIKDNHTLNSLNLLKNNNLQEFKGMMKTKYGFKPSDINIIVKKLSSVGIILNSLLTPSLISHSCSIFILFFFTIIAIVNNATNLSHTDNNISHNEKIIMPNVNDSHLKEKELRNKEL
jgi:hypothetical protein